MNRKQKTKRSGLPKLLSVLIVVSSLLVALIGSILKYTVCKSADILQDTSVMAIPFILMQDVSMRTAIAQNHIPKDDPIILATDEESVQASSTETEDTQQQKTYSLGPVDESYWSGVLFIGDSRTDGLKFYAPMAEADYFSAPSLSSYDVLEPSTVLSQEGHFEASTLVQLLSSKQYHAVYIMLGINEIGHSMDGIQQKHQQLIDQIRALQPDIPIVLQASFRVTKSFSEANVDFSLERFQALETTLASMADNQTIFFINGNHLFIDEEGYFRADLTGDGSHPYAANYELYREFLMENGVQ